MFGGASAVERPHRAVQRPRRDPELAFRLVDRGDDVVAFGAEEGLGNGRHAIALTLDGVGDDLQLG